MFVGLGSHFMADVPYGRHANEKIGKWWGGKVSRVQETPNASV